MTETEIETMAQSSRFENKVYIITGAASGMGLATAKLLRDRGANIAVCDVNEDTLRLHFSPPGPDTSDANAGDESKIYVQKVDVTNETQLTNFLHTTKQKFGRVDGIANFAGTGGHRLGQQLIWETEGDEYDFIMDLNVRSLYYVLKGVLKPGFLNENEGEGGSSIVHITSMYAERGFQNGAVFTASKHAANGMVKSASLEVARRGVRVNTVMPGAIDTPMLRGGRTDIPPPKVPMGRFGLPEEIARMTAFLLGPEASYITGAHFTVDGGANAAGRHE